MKLKQNILEVENLKLNTLEVEMKNTTLLIIEGYDAFFMCGALDVNIYKDREVICGKAIKVKTIDELLHKPIFDCSDYAKINGILPGMTVYEAFKKISQKK